MPSLLDPALDPDRAEKLIKGAKSDPIAFAFGLGQTPDKSVMAVDKSKAGKALFELCRKEGGAKKGAYGTVRVVGSTAVFACEKDEVSDLAKAVLAYFKANKIGLKAEVLEEDATSEAEGEEPGQDDARRGKERAADEKSRQSEAEERETEEEEDDDDVPEGKIYDPGVIVPLIRKAKKKARPFAFGTGPDVNILAMHPKMEPVRLAKKVRAEGAKKGVWGTVLLDGSVAVFTCEKEPFAGVKKGIKRWLKDQKLNLKFRVQGPEGDYEDPEDAEEVEAEAEETAGIDARAQAMERLRERGLALVPTLREISAARADLADAIRATMQEFGQVSKGTDTERATALLQSLETLAREPATPPAPRGAVGFAKLLLRWREAQKQAAENLAALGKSLLALDEVKQDPRLSLVQRAVEKMATLVPEFGEALSDQVDELMTKGATAEGKAAAQAALKTIEDYRRQLDAAEALQRLEGFAKQATGAELKVHGLLADALADLQSELVARA